LLCKKLLQVFSIVFLQIIIRFTSVSWNLMWTYIFPITVQRATPK
jgi:hypothetical protein